MATEANDMVIITNANAVSLKKGTGEKTLFKLSNTVTSVGQGSFSTGLNAISIGSNGEGSGIIPFYEATEVVEGKLVINTIRRSGTGGSAPASNYVMMYNPDTQPNEATYSSDIPQKVSNLETDVNTLETNLNGSTFAIGAGSSATGTNSMALGNNATTSTYDNAVAIGNGATAAANDVFILGNSTTNVGINVGNPTQKLQLQDGNIYLGFLNTTQLVFGQGLSNQFNGMRVKQNNEMELFSASATYLFATNGIAYESQWVGASDIRLKKDIVPLQNGINVIKKLNPVNYKKKICDMKTCDDISMCEQIYTIEDWFIAQEIEQIPELEHSISSPTDSDVKGLNYNCILTYCVKAVQEQQEIIEAEKAKVATLESQVADLLSRVSALENPP